MQGVAGGFDKYEGCVMKTITICKANPIGKVAEVESVTIEISLSLPDIQLVQYVDTFYSNQTIILADALYNSLPQGTFDRLLYAMMGKKLKDSMYSGLTGGR